MEKTFKKGEIVWAKVRGYSWWPGVVKKITLKLNNSDNSNTGVNKINSGNKKEVRILVKFIGDDSHSVLPLEKIEKFEKKFSEFSKTKKKPLQNSIKIAKKLHSGEISLLELNKNIAENINNKSISPDFIDFSDEESSKEKDSEISDFICSENEKSSNDELVGKKNREIKKGNKKILKKLRFHSKNQSEEKNSKKRKMPKINIFPNNFKKIYNPNINHFSSFDSFNFNSFQTSDKNNNKSNYFPRSDNNGFILNTNLNMQKILNYNINNINTENPMKKNEFTSNSKNYIKLLERKKKIENDLSNLESSDIRDINYAINLNTINSKKIKNKFIHGKKNSKIRKILDNSNESHFDLLDNNSNSKINSDLSLDENEVNQDIKLINNDSDNQTDENNDSIDKRMQLRKACDGLLFYKINPYGSSHGKNLLANINKIQTILDELKNYNTFELIYDVLPILKILLNSKDVSVFLASTELCQKIKEKSLSELFDFQTEVNIKDFNEIIVKKSPKDFSEINRLELINVIISEKLKELKKKEEANKIKEIKKLKEIKRLNSVNARNTENSKRNFKKKYEDILIQNFTDGNSRNQDENKKNNFILNKNNNNIIISDKIPKMSRINCNEINSIKSNSIDKKNNLLEERNGINFFSKKMSKSFNLGQNILININDISKEDYKPDNKILLKKAKNYVEKIDKKHYRSKNITEITSESSGNILLDSPSKIGMRGFNSESRSVNHSSSIMKKLEINSNSSVLNNNNEIFKNNYINNNERISNFNNYINNKENEKHENYNISFENSNADILKYLFEEFIDLNVLISIIKNENKSHNDNLENLNLPAKNDSTNFSENFEKKSILTDNKYTGNCFDDYNKFNNLSIKSASKRKNVCLKLYNILKTLLPEVESSILKKIVIQFDYVIRQKDPELGDFYNNKFYCLYEKIKDVYQNKDKLKSIKNNK